MGTKVDYTTVEGMRRIMHEHVDTFFGSLKKNEDGTPVDVVEVRTNKATHVTDGGGMLIEGAYFGVEVRYRRPEILPAPGRFPILRTPQGAFLLLNPVLEAMRVLVKHLGIDEEVAVNQINAGHPFTTDKSIMSITQATNLAFTLVDGPKLTEALRPPEPAQGVATDEEVHEVVALLRAAGELGEDQKLAQEDAVRVAVFLRELRAMEGLLTEERVLEHVAGQRNFVINDVITVARESGLLSPLKREAVPPEPEKPVTEMELEAAAKLDVRDQADREFAESLKKQQGTFTDVKDVQEFTEKFKALNAADLVSDPDPGVTTKIETEEV